MFFGQSVFGVLGVAASTSKQNISIRQFDFVERVALDLSNLAQDASLLDKTLALVAMDERNRLAKDLHDSVTQVLFTATLLAEVLPQIWQKNPEQGLQSLEKLRKLTKGALAEMRTMLIELRPSAVLNTSLSELIAQLTDALTSRIGVPFKLFIEQIPILPDDVQVNFYRIAQEALNNVVKHANTKKANVFLRYEPANVSVEVVDEGRGFDPQAAGSNGRVSWGLKNMEERAVLLGGRFKIHSHPAKGTKVEVSIPLIAEPEVRDDDPPAVG